VVGDIEILQQLSWGSYSVKWLPFYGCWRLFRKVETLVRVRPTFVQSMKHGLGSALKALAGIAGLVFLLAPITSMGILVSVIARGGHHHKGAGK